MSTPNTLDRATELISPAQLAAELGIPTQTVYRWRTEGKGPRGRRIGRHVRFARHDVDAWLESVADDVPGGSR